MLGTGGDTNVYPTEKSLLTGMGSTSVPEEEVSAGDSDSGGVIWEDGYWVSESSWSSLHACWKPSHSRSKAKTGRVHGLRGPEWTGRVGSRLPQSLPFSFCLCLSLGSLLFLPHSCFSMRKLGCLAVHLWSPGPGTFFIWRSSCVSSCQWAEEGKPNLSTELTTQKGLRFRLPSAPSCSDVA